MPLIASQKNPSGYSAARAAENAHLSHALEWLWQDLSDVRRPRVLDCGKVSPPTLELLTRRGSKVYLVDLVSPLQRQDPALWDLSKKISVFRTSDFLAQLPDIPPDSLSAIFCWQVFDLIPREALPALVERLWSHLEPGGGLFCILREPELARGAETRWRLERLTHLVIDHEGHSPFPYPALTNRDIERLFASGSLKTFLTRAGRREVLAIK